MASFRGHSFGMLDNPPGDPEGIVLEALEQNLTHEEIAQQHGGLIERSQGPTEA